MNKYAIAVMSLDRVGIISSVTGTILKLGGNMDKMSQTVMDGCFTILITAVFPDETIPEEVRRAIEEEGDRFHLDVSVRPYRDPMDTPTPARQNVYFLTVTGHDRKGIVHEITSSLASHGINILDLYCFIRETENFVLIGEIDIPDQYDLQQVQIDLEEAAEQDLAVRIQHENFFRATNELYISRRAQGL